MIGCSRTEKKPRLHGRPGVVVTRLRMQRVAGILFYTGLEGSHDSSLKARTLKNRQWFPVGQELCVSLS